MRYKHQRQYSRKQVATALVYARERTLVMSACVVFMLALATYMYFLSVSVINVVVRQEIEVEIDKTSHTISLLEERYMSAQQKVTKDAATEKGFSLASDKIYVEREEATLVLRANDES